MGRLPGPGALSTSQDLPLAPLLGDRPTFREPWQAKAFALVVLLHREGHFSWDEWVRTLAAQINGSPQRGDEDADQAYHRQFLAALESIVAARGLTRPEALAGRTEAWRRAYINTPHGQPVDLAAAEHEHNDHDAHADHDLVARRTPCAVSPARSSGRGGETRSSPSTGS